MDAFYASVEQRDHPELRGRPVIVGGPKDARGVVSAASYEARVFGVHSAMPLRNAARLCPDGAFVRVRMKQYAEVSRQVFAVFARYSPLVEPLSIDEAFLDMTGCERLFGGPVEAARGLRADIRAEVGLTASVGVAPNKFVAKIASDLEKPDGLVVAPREGLEEFLAPLPVSRMWGVGPRGAEALKRVGISTFAELAQASSRTLRAAFGSSAERLQDLARGRDARAIVTARGPKSIGHETTFSQNIRDRDELFAVLVALADQVAARVRRHGLKARTIQLKLRYAPFQTVTRRVTLDSPTCGSAPLIDASRALLDRHLRRGAEIRLLGVSVSGFSAQATLFAGSERECPEVDSAVDQIRAKFGTAALRRGSVVKR